MSNLLMYTTEDGRSQIQLRAKSETVWLSQREMAELFDGSTDNVGLHFKNLFEDGELSRDAATEESSVVQNESARKVQRPVTLYNLDANGFPLLSGAGSVSHARVDQKLEPLYLDFDQRRKTEEARTADAQDEADLKALENAIKNRPKP